jgi:hypothetical protein
MSGGCKSQDQTEDRSSPATGSSVSGLPGSAGSGSRPRFSAEVLASASRLARTEGKDTLGDLLYEGKCPNWVRGARSELREVAGGIVVTVTAKSEADVTEIRARAKYLAEGKSEPPDGTGLCPVHRDAAIEAVDIDGGSRITARPSSKLSLEQLRKAATVRLQRLPESQRVHVDSPER